jgi:hypothetical protein
MRIALVPLDERPVNVQLPRQVAAIAGAELILPPAEAMPDFRRPADIAALHEWLSGLVRSEGADSLVVCVDTLVHGGIIPARITSDTTTVALARLDLLRELKAASPPIAHHRGLPDHAGEQLVLGGRRARVLGALGP